MTSTLNASARSAIASAFVDTLEGISMHGNVVTLVCNKAAAYLKGEPMQDDDRKAICDTVAKARGWKGPALKVRTSEVNSVLKCYGTLPEAIEALQSKAKRCTWHDSLKLARCLNKGMAAPKAVAMTIKKGAGAVVPVSGRVASALKSWHKETPRKRDAIEKAAALLGLDIDFSK